MYYSTIPTLTSRITDIFIILASFKVRERSMTAGREWHHFITSINQSFIIHLFKNPPNKIIIIITKNDILLPYALHEPRVHGLVIVLKVDPSSHPGHYFLPHESHIIITWTHLTSHCCEYLITILRHSALYLATPILVTSSGV